MKDVAFVTPIYPPHYKYANELIASFYSYGLDKQAHLWFVFSNKCEQRKFYSNHPFMSITIPEHYKIDRGIINRKKFYSLRYLHSYYDYLITIDSETLFIKNVGIKELCDRYFNEKMLLGNHATANTDKITRECAKLFHNIIAPLVAPYLWFNQLCIYKSSHISHFFNTIHYDDIIHNIKWEHFDYYIYMFYLILYHGFKIYDTGIIARYGAMEGNIINQNVQLPDFIKQKIYGTKYSNIDIFDNPNLFVSYHRDRK